MIIILESLKYIIIIYNKVNNVKIINVIHNYGKIQY